MKGEVIVVDIGTDGSVKADVQKGPGGAGCVKELLALLDGTGLAEGDISHKREYHQRVVAPQKAKVGQ
jgi:hypothetical protein